ncbi:MULTISPECIES: hypothetical protein [Vibrio]|uniref:hypothetical protein n=1 Tax=Vibrio TaxID=662 RepID=UPI001CDB883E|nr:MULTISPECIES: hypothetical protein [Vibrio]EIK0772036.1 hypothetical protein [Vibrio alginolyticus]MCA2487455.1 hypothetical protein [Vibrio alginolyticus]MDW1780189.1 hypothetical protein [Vibrio sp. Vb2134]MDW2084557.1 hypothetical protein [Vibrio sp. 2134-1]MDW2123445.1 hypothetical protein [Vibrio sp. 2033]
MHLVCKFIPSSKLSSNELSYVLTPDECIGQLSRLRNSDDILRNLPKELAQKISISAKKTTSALLAAIRIELGKGNWVSLSTVARRSPLTDSQLQSFPRLKSLVDSVPASNESKVFKAGYKQVTDDVALVRSYTHVPSEPSPDQKIVVEFAGQWSSNAACLMLGKTDAQKEKVTVGKADTENKHRSLATFKDLEAEGKTLYIKIPCTDQPQPILLKLAEDLQPVDKETQMDEWDNVLVPVRPLAYLDGSNDKAKASDLRGGFLYVFWKGKLWREMAINEKGYYQDVDVEYYRTLDQEEKKKDTPQVIQRSASGFAMAHFWAPYKISGEIQQGENGLKIIFSPKQKRFAQIEALESDAALLEKSSTPLDELSSYSDEQSFSAQEFTSDVDSAAIHKVTEDDMPWLSDQQAIVRSYDQSNTVIAYVDGKNSGFQLSVETGLIDFNTPVIHYAVISDSESDWVLSEALQYDQENPHFATAQLGGFPPKGKFTLQITSPGYTHHSELVFQDLTLEQIQNWSTPTQMAERVEPEPERSEQELNAEDNLSQYMSLWKQELGM